jgi:hypothetical protein
LDGETFSLISGAKIGILKMMIKTNNERKFIKKSTTPTATMSFESTKHAIHQASETSKVKTCTPRFT